MSYNKMQYKRQSETSHEKSALYTALKDAVNIYTAILKGLLHAQLVAEKPAEDRENVLADEREKTRGVVVKGGIGTGDWSLEMTGETYLESEVRGKSEMEGENSHHLPPAKHLKKLIDDFLV